MSRVLGLGVLSVVLLLAAGSVAFAQQEEYLEGKIRTGDSITVGGDETVDGDLYLFGGTIEIDGVVDGDLIAFGGQVSINGTVTGDALVGSGTLSVPGTVDGDLRVGAGQVGISGDVSEDLMAGVGLLALAGTVGEDVVFGSGSFSVSGEVGGDVLGRAGTYSNEGSVSGSETVTIEDNSREVDRTSPIMRAVTRFAALFLIGLALLWVAQRPLVTRVSTIETAPGPVIGWGLIFLAGLVVGPLLALVVGGLLTVFFAWLGLNLLVGVTITAMVLSVVVVAVVGFVMVTVLAPITVGAWGGGRLLPKDVPAYLSMAAGVAVLVVVGFVPILGALVGLAVTITGAGAWTRWSGRARSGIPGMNGHLPRS